MLRQPFNSTDDLFEESRERRKNLLAVVIAHDQFSISTRSQEIYVPSSRKSRAKYDRTSINLSHGLRRG